MAIDPNVINHSTITNPGGLATGVVVNPFLPVEINRESDASQYDVIEDPNPLPDFSQDISGGPSEEIISLTILGNDTINVGNRWPYEANVAGTIIDTSQGTFLWTSDDNRVTIEDPDLVRTFISYLGPKDITFNLTCTYTEDGVSGSPVSDTKNVGII